MRLVPMVDSACFVRWRWTFWLCSPLVELAVGQPAIFPPLSHHCYFAVCLQPQMNFVPPFKRVAMDCSNSSLGRAAIPIYHQPAAGAIAAAQFHQTAPLMHLQHQSIIPVTCEWRRDLVRVVFALRVCTLRSAHRGAVWAFVDRSTTGERKAWLL